MSERRALAATLLVAALVGWAGVAFAEETTRAVSPDVSQLATEPTHETAPKEAPAAEPAAVVAYPASGDEASAATAPEEPTREDPSEAGSAAAFLTDDYDPTFDEYDPLLDEIEDDLIDQDPFETANRWTFAFNQKVDQFVLDPLTRGYQFVVPTPVRRCVSRVFENLNSPVVFANELLQLRPKRAATTLTRFVVNSTLGLGGLFDVGEDVMQLPRSEADFAQTLARYDVPMGPYLVVPVLGPSTARGAVGTVVDVALDPVTYIVGPLNITGTLQIEWLVLGGSEGLVLRDANLDALHALRDGSVDYYSALRSAYLQNRRAMAREAQRGDSEELVPVPEPAQAVDVTATPEPESVQAVDANETTEPAAGERAPAPLEAVDQELVPEANASTRSSIAAINASKSPRFTMPENSDLRSASSDTVPSR